MEDGETLSLEQMRAFLEASGEVSFQLDVAATIMGQAELGQAQANIAAKSVNSAFSH
ncbi:MAG TPA: hypothetical protein VMZ52_05175 [Bryobacteraceae bacterium]|nr:hypothetical protein [Bryobacteraceae bacterium]